MTKKYGQDQATAGNHLEPADGHIAPPSICISMTMIASTVILCFIHLRMAELDVKTLKQA